MELQTRRQYSSHNFLFIFHEANSVHNYALSVEYNPSPRAATRCIVKRNQATHTVPSCIAPTSKQSHPCN